MFERRLKIFLVLVSILVAFLLVRAAQLQVLQRDDWKGEASKALQNVAYLPTHRGTIVDRKHHELAVDRPCMNACVDYRAIVSPADPQWLHQTAMLRAKAAAGPAWDNMSRKEQQAAVKTEMPAVQTAIDQMWDRLAQLSGKTREEIEQIRQDILKRVEIRKRFSWYYAYRQAQKKDGDDAESPDESVIERWLNGDSDAAPQIDKFAVTVSEEKMPHVILHAISLDVQNELGRHPERYPGLSLLPGLERYYPYADTACQVIGHLERVNQDEVNNDKGTDQRRQYLPNDLIGRTGLEGLCEPALRGTLGRSITVEGDEGPAQIDPAQPGQTVATTLDIDLQRDIQECFADATLHEKGVVTEEHAVLHGAAVVLDVKSNQVLALVSYPTYDLNHYEEEFQSLKRNVIDYPLRDRATESQFEPGSTVKPLVGLGAITQGVIGINEGIECKGYLELPNHHGGVVRFGKKLGRCWVASMFGEYLHDAVAHHPIPIPHQGHDGNPDGFLTYSDALERSCNIYFETVADRLGPDALTAWMNRFGLGRKTGIGISEARGRVPGNPDFGSAFERRIRCFLGGIGQGNVAATPIQMANVAAIIARNGMWMRPVLLMPDAAGKLPTTRPNSMNGPDRIDLHLSPQALAACKLGMTNVVNGPAGTGKGAHMREVLVAGKTGTAQATPLKIVILDEKGEPKLDEHKHKMYEGELQPSTKEHPNPQAPWYRGVGDGKTVDHSWMIGFAPADDPRVAFAVLVEYGGSGGGAAADVVRTALESCIAHGYLTPSASSAAPVAQGDTAPN